MRLFRYMSGRPFSIIDTNIDPDRNGILFDPLPAGTYTGVGEPAITVENSGGRNGAYGPNYIQLDARIGYRLRMPQSRTLDVFVECFNLTNDRTSRTRRETEGCRISSSTTDWSPEGSRGNCRSGHGSAFRRIS